MSKSKVKTPESQLEEQVREVLSDLKIALADGNREMAQIYQIELNTLRAKLDRLK
jgi:hypothetical protein